MRRIAVERLREGARASLIAHFVALSLRDRSLRFGAALPPRAIACYVGEIDFSADAVFGVYDDDRALAGVAHLALDDRVGELGLSVLPPHRCRGVGGALFERAATHARNRAVPQLLMRCLRGDASIMRIARRFGMDVVRGNRDADARLDLPPGTLASFGAEVAAEALAACNSARRRLAAAWRRRRAGGRIEVS